jgi:WD40 repeat protein
VWDLTRLEEVVLIIRQTFELGVEPNQYGEVYSSWGRFNRFGSLAFSPDSKTLALSFANQLRFVDLPSGRERARLIDGDANISRLCYANKSSFGAYASADHSVRLWSDAHHPQTRLLFKHSLQTISLEFSPDDKYLATVFSDREMRLWDIASGECLLSENLRYEERQNHTAVMSFLAEGEGIVLLGRDGGLRIRNISFAEERREIDLQGLTPMGLAVSSDGSVIAISGVGQDWKSGGDTDIVVVRTDTGAITSRVAGQFWEPNMKLSRDGRFLSATTLSANGLRVWDLSATTPSPHLILALNHEPCIDFFSNCRQAVTAGTKDNYASIWDLTRRDEGTLVTDDEKQIKGVAFGPDGRLAVSDCDKSAPERWWSGWAAHIPDQAMDLWFDRALEFHRLFRAEPGRSELMICRRDGRTPVAWLPLSVDNIQEHPFAHIWAGIQNGQLVVAELSKLSDTETKYCSENLIHC